MRIILASNNKNKLKELKSLLEPKGFEVISQREAGVDKEAEENGTTFEENALIKARAIYGIMKCAVIADDSGLEVDALNGEPGVYSHRYAGENATDSDRCDKVLGLMKDVADAESTARFVCAVAYIDSDGKESVVRGTCEGVIGREKRGSNGFGYDPIFYVGEKSFAQLSEEEKNGISHRGNALKKFILYICKKS